MTPISTYYSTYLQHPLEAQAQHPLETSQGLVERRDSIQQDWQQILSQFDQEPEMIKLIQSCKKEEDRRRQEERKMKLKEYQVLSQLQIIQSRRQMTAIKDFALHLPSSTPESSS